MREWRLEDLQRCWSEVIAEPDQWPQRVIGPGGDAYIISPDLYTRFFDRGIRFDGDEWAELDDEPPSEDGADRAQHSHPPVV
jgi:hypothetical protein